MQFEIADIQRYLQRFYRTSRYLITPFGYPITFNDSIGPAGAATASQVRMVNIQANADFLLIGVAHYFPTSTDLSIQDKLVGDVTIDFRESGSKEPFTDSPVMLENYSFNGINVRELDYPRFLAGGTNIEATIRNLGDQAFSGGLSVYLNGFLVRVFN
jgi:hypothetical protein